MATMRDLIKDALNKGLTQRELANKIGFSHGTVQKILFTNTKFTYETRRKVADYFRVPVSQFYDSSVEIPLYPQEPHSPTPPDDLLAVMVKQHGAALLELQRTVNVLHERIDKLGGEIGAIKDRLMDASATGDIKRLDIVTLKGPSSVN